MTTKQHLIAAYEAAIQEQGPNAPITVKLRQLINISYPDVGAALISSSALNGGPIVAQGTRVPITYSSQVVKKKETSLDAAAEKAVELLASLKEVATQDNETALSDEYLTELAEYNEEELLELLGADKIRALAKTLGYKIHHKSSDETFVKEFLSNLKKSVGK
jgi:hypothetical protein